ncbi:MAG TPA: malto-oligosyltrehalose synthase [Mycobacteriales bacterium]|nr:malto-oligosyltrehalose synthase [Mycobacteriales bacterium]
MPTEPRVLPTATYRVQLHSGFTLDDAAELAPQLADLGISHLYCSPYLASTPGSAHGYDVVDHARVDDDLGGEPAHVRLSAALQEHGLGQVLDIVPNHMTVAGAHNRAWWSVLRDGQASEYAHWFDIDWDRHGGRVLLPVLGDPLSVVLDRGELTISATDDGAVLRYFDHVMPLASSTDGSTGNGRVTEALLAAQHYQLAHWRDVPTELNYRRFFDVTTLAGLRVEDPDVFDATHERILGWLDDATLDGIRIDHPDGLADPAGYLRRIASRGPQAWVVVEKILEPGEDLPPWPVAGTTGYDALSLVQQVFLDPAAAEPLERVYGELTGAETDYDAVALDARLQVLRQILVPEVDRVAGLLTRLCSDAVPAPAHDAVGDSVRAVLASFGVYRTYVTYATGPSPADRHHIETALQAARAVVPPPDDQVLDVLRRVLLAEQRGPVEEELLRRWQQTTGPAMAKGVEDTTFYRYHRLAALNEVGSHPATFGVSGDAFHDACRDAQRDWPLRMTTLSTHDTKRSEDARARLVALAELTDLWGDVARGWFERHEQVRCQGGLDRPIVYLLFQTMVAAHPLPFDRAAAYLEKASREAKEHTSWVDPDPAYDAALRAFVADVLADRQTQAELAQLMAVLEPHARTVSLGQKLVQLTMPGVPDVYQGCELWDHSLVDPDNRRPVDHALRARLLAELPGLSIDDLVARAPEGIPKLAVTAAALRLRRSVPAAFGAAGDYQPLSADGPRADHCLAFARGGTVLTVVTRLPGALAGDWAGTALTLPAGEWTDRITGATCAGGPQPLDSLLARLPVALLERTG